VKFVDQNGDGCTPTQGQAFLYFGDNSNLFAECFIDVGIIFARGSRPGWAA
jgi:hypothetical protein